MSAMIDEFFSAGRAFNAEFQRRQDEWWMRQNAGRINSAKEDIVYRRWNRVEARWAAKHAAKPQASDATMVFVRLSTGEDTIVTCDPPWPEAFCEHVTITTALGYTIVIFHRWGDWKYTDSVHGPGGKQLWDFDDGYPEPQHELIPEHYRRLRELLPAKDLR